MTSSDGAPVFRLACALERPRGWRVEPRQQWRNQFGYVADWLRWDHAQPVSLSLPLTTRRYTGDTVMAVFDNLLPDNADIRRRVAGWVGAEGDDPYSLLAAVGRDYVGALQFLPDGAPRRDDAGRAFWCGTE